MHQDFFSKFKISCEKKLLLVASMGYLFDMPLGSAFEIGAQIILLKIDGFLKGWISNITHLKLDSLTTL